MKTFDFLPEGALIHTEKNNAATNSEEALCAAFSDSRIIEGIATMCDAEHNLTVSFGRFSGIIPHAETALGIDIGKTREIAIISRVGKPVCCIITDMADGKILLSRKKAQERALTKLFTSYMPGDVIPATVTHIEPFGVFADIGCGNISLLGIEAISVSRISHPKDRFSVGDKIFVVISGFDYEKERVLLSSRELFGTWEENARKFAPGETVRGIVRGIENYGIFVELAPNLSGLSEPFENVSVGDSVSVFIKSIVPEKMKIKLVIIDNLGRSFERRIKHSDYFIRDGHIDSWCYSPNSSERIKNKAVFGIKKEG